MSFPLISLTTDFGVTDHFAGTMKGVILAIAPRARLVDITHEIAPFNVGEAAFVISQAWRYFPKRTIHVVVVDPGVGSARRPILVEAGGQYFVGPDNGVFSMIYDAAPSKVREITNAKLRLSTVSRTFHGRDIFAPAAAHLAGGVSASRFGKLIHDAVRPLTFRPAHLKGSVWRGLVLKVDRFGNLITNLHVHEFPDIKTQPMEIRIARGRIHRLALTYADTAAGELFAIVGSSGYIEIAMNQASAAVKLGCAAGSTLELEFV
jgi:S-adenosylmethionine hydrolase